jgi:hypothetical protein
VSDLPARLLRAERECVLLGAGVARRKLRLGQLEQDLLAAGRSGARPTAPAPPPTTVRYLSTSLVGSLASGLVIEVYDADPATTGVLQQTLTTDVAAQISPTIAGTGTTVRWFKAVGALSTRWPGVGGFGSTSYVVGPYSLPSTGSFTSINMTAPSAGWPYQIAGPIGPIPLALTLTATSSTFGATPIVYDGARNPPGWYGSPAWGTVYLRSNGSTSRGSFTPAGGAPAGFGTGPPVLPNPPAFNFTFTLSAPNGGTWSITE